MKSKHCTIAKVQIAGGKDIFLPITGKSKPEISPVLMGKWQNIADLSAKAINCQAALIMRLSPGEIEVFISSAGKDNPYSPFDSEQLGMGLYCETVVGTRETLHIPNALADEEWKNNPDIKLHMISYLGMPIKWPDGELFGTICVLDNKEHAYSDTHIELMAHFRNSVETDLHMLLEREELRRLNLEKDLSLREAHHRIKNHLSMLTGILQLSSYKDITTQEDIAELIEDLTNRIRAIAELHSHIALAEYSQIDLETFLETISATIIDSIADRDITLRFESMPVEVDRQTFFHVGLLVSELITNALKHAFSDTAAPEISLTLKNLDENTFSLIVRDNGSGLPEGFRPKDCDSIGMMLISDLPLQMGGSYTYSSGNGTTFEFILEKRSGETDEIPPQETD